MRDWYGQKGMKKRMERRGKNSDRKGIGELEKEGKRRAERERR